MAMLPLELKAAVSPGTPTVGDNVTLTLYVNVPNTSAQVNYSVSDSLGHAWTKVSEDAEAAVYTTRAATDGTMTITGRLTRVADNATTTAVLAPTVQATAVTSTHWGVSMSDESHPETNGVNWRSAHCYDPSDIIKAQDFTILSAQYSDSSIWTVSNALNGGDAHDSVQNAWTRLPSLDRLEISWGNEVDRHVAAGQMGRFDSNFQILAAKALEFPNTFVGVSFTGNCFRSSKINQFTNFIEDRLQGRRKFLAGNLYPPGRQQSPPFPTPFKDYVDPVLNFCDRHGVQNFACWETGMPIFSNNGYTRPTYFKDFHNYVLNKAANLGIHVLSVDYWDQSIGIDNRLFHDAPNTALKFISGT